MASTFSTHTTISFHDHQRFVLDLLTASGAMRSDAETVAQALLWSDLRGRHTHGLMRLPILIKRLSRGLIQSPAAMSWTLLAPAICHLDADHGFGQVAGRAAMEQAIKLARSQGIGLVAVSHSNHYGAASYYCAQAAEASCLGITCTNAVPKVAPFGGKRPVLGTNPLAFGCPTASGTPVLVDLSTGALSGSEVRYLSDENGGRLPPNSALDSNGKPTDAPAAVSSGCLLPAAGPKGFGLGLMVEILSGILTGAAMSQEVGSLFQTWDRPANVGHLFIAIRVDRFMPREEFLTRMETLLGWILDCPRQHENKPIRFPGQIRGKYAERYTQEGIPLTKETVRALDELAGRLSVKRPW